MNQFKGFIPLLMGVIAIIAGYFFTYPQWTDLSTNRASLAAAEAENARVKEAEAQMQTFLSQYNNSSDKLEGANKVLPLNHGALQDVLGNLDSYATASGISLASVAFADSGTNATKEIAEYTVTYIDLTISASGTYPSYRNFLLQLENSLRLVDIHTINLAAGESGNMDLKFVARVYYQK
jgi:hypothetical protein